MTLNSGKLTIALVLNCLSFCAFAENELLNNAIQSIVDGYLAKEGKREASTGVAVSISYPKGNRRIQQSYFAGKTSQQPDAQPIGKDTLFDIGSITKSYTAALILQLEDEGFLTINDPIGKWLPQYPKWKNVTIKQLLNMTSGIPNYSATPKFSDYLQDNLTAEYKPEFLLSFAYPDKPIVSGKKFEYSNSNYVLASLIIEANTQENFANLLQKRLLKPLDLHSTFYAAGPNWKTINQTLLPRKAHGYYYDYKTKTLYDLTNVNASWGGAAGAIVSNTTDQLKWVDELYQGKLFSEKNRGRLLKELKSLVSMKNGQAIKTVDKNDPAAFGLGVALGYTHNQRFWFYEGSSLGYRMMYIWKPCSNISVLAALNSKGGENDPDSPAGDHIKDLLFSIYKKIIDANPELICKD